ncbi:transmembrane protein 70 homolog, mitochondrial [Pararge aegeria]|uniref:Jg16005 protein n=2 Tax=Pararge aegeria TaxID=116150 RepID=A0A8S4SIT3_9NEOP|nr:transmembrane protein 70 homolog, mitochondrial [Pararge aegeria]CAH2268980.1 jg16005 [Pararge aegeria aegeria]
MFRICQQKIYLQNKSIFRNDFYKDFVKPNSKVISICQKTIARHYANKEKLENKFEKIYYGPLTPQIRAVKIFSVSSSAAGLAAQPLILNEAANIGSTSLIIALCSVVGFFTFVTPILLHLITKKYVTEIHYDPETSTYKATTINFFLSPVVLEFKADEVDVPDIPGMFTTMNAKGKPLFIEARHFTDPLYYAKIMGYDKPLDFKLGEDQSSDNKSS